MGRNEAHIRSDPTDTTPPPLAADAKQSRRPTVAASPWPWLPPPPLLLLSAPASSSSSSNTLRFPLRRRRASRPLAVAAFKKLSEASPVPIPLEPTQPLVDEDTLPPKPGVYGVYDPAGRG